jgi:diguanylate cyclase (GGDEF)-like protein
MGDGRRFASLTDRLSSFRTRLRLFFLLIVIVPMISVTLIVFRLIAESEHGQADARVAARQDAAISLYYEARADADRVARRIGADPGLAAALRRNRPAEVQAAARRLLAQTAAARVLVSAGDRPVADAGDRNAVFPATRELVNGDQPVARLQVSTQDATRFAGLVKRVTRLETVVRDGDRVVASTLPAAQGARLPDETGSVELSDKKYRAATFAAPGFLGGGQVRVSVLEPERKTSDAIRNGRLLASLILLGFFLLALMSAIVVSRSLQRQIGEFLAAARRLGSGDFSAEVPTRGRDEFAALGNEFNKMSTQLETRLEELRQERTRLELSLRRIGETFASNLDRDALLDIVVQTAIDAISADGGRAVARGGEPLAGMAPVARSGDPGALGAVVEAAEHRVLVDGAPAFVAQEAGTALAHPLRAGPAAGEAAHRVTGLISVWREGRPFTDQERELFHYLAGQAAVSVENVGLHETVERQAVTDELTGLSNRRRFQETMATEVERSKRFGQDVGLVLLDIDDFKRVNDTYGHQQGDVVLREVARILRESCREIDEPARYGGEELAVVLPGTDLEGAFNLAERVREGIEGLHLPVTGNGGSLSITASFGVAALPACAEDMRGLVAAADEALYEAKRGGKNKTVSAA